MMSEQMTDFDDGPRRRWDERYATLSPQKRREPTPFVRACLPHLPPSGWALDVAAGAGRHSLALAQHGLAVDAVDISGYGLRLAQQRAQIAGLSLGLIAADVERPWLPHRRYDVILVSFFLHRPLFGLIKNRLKPGGWLVYETYTTAQLLQPHHPPMRPDFLLQPGELKATFADFKIFLYDEGEHSRRMTAQLLAQKLE
jgi:tellurite methyltransferase